MTRHRIRRWLGTLLRPSSGTTRRRTEHEPDVGAPSADLGRRASAAGKIGDALRDLDQALAKRPTDPRLLTARGALLFDWGRVIEALSTFEVAIAHGGVGATLYKHMGDVFMALSAPRTAEDWIRRAQNATPKDPDPYARLSIALQAQGRLQQAIEAAQLGLDLDPRNHDCLINLGHCLCLRGDVGHAESLFRTAIEVRPDSAVAWTNLGVSQCQQALYPQGIESLRRAADIEAATGRYTNNVASLIIELRDASRIEEALSAAKVLPLHPLIEAEYALALTLLTAGNLPPGWWHHETRLLRQPLASHVPKFNAPVWQGQDLREKSILLCHEQGMGDSIQLLRYASVLKNMGARVLFAPPPALNELSAHVRGIDEIVADRAVRFDYYIHLMSLPRVLGTTLATIPRNIPYITVDPVRAQRWKERLNSVDGLKVGLVWAGNPLHLKDHQRSIPFEMLKELWTVQGVRFYSLQKGPASSDVAKWLDQQPIEDLSADLHDFVDTVAAMTQLDLVISVDTSVAHLAGAVGIATWLLLPRPADWRWLETGSDTPWYPSIRLFRQQARGDWAGVASAVKDRLTAAATGTEVLGCCGVAPAAGSGAIAENPAPAMPLPWRPGAAIAIHTRYGPFRSTIDTDPVGQSLSAYGEWQRRELEIISRFIGIGDTILEVGAGIGFHATVLARMIDDQGHLFAAEVDRSLRVLLRQNVAAAGLRNVSVLSRPLGGASYGQPNDDSSAATSDTVDDLALQDIQFLKCSHRVDPLALITEAAETIARHRPGLLLAVNEVQQIPDLVHSLRSFEYRCWTTTTPLFDPQNFNRRTDDIFDGRLYTSVLGAPKESNVAVRLEDCEELR